MKLDEDEPIQCMISLSITIGKGIYWPGFAFNGGIETRRWLIAIELRFINLIVDFRISKWFKLTSIIF